jgi:chromate transporter
MKSLSSPESLHGVPPESARHPSFGEAFLFWLKLGFISFGGPTGQIAVMHAELVEKKKWISEARFLHALNYCMLLPGPEAQQLATYVGWLLHKTWGGIVAGAFFVIPSIFILWGLSYIYVTLGNLPWIAAIFYGLKPAVLAIVAAAVIRIGSRALKNEVMWTLAAAAFIAIFFLRVPFPLIIISAALIGFFGGKWKRDKFLVIRGHGKAKNDSVLDDSSAVPEHAKPSWNRALRVCITWTLLWWAPVILLGFWLGSNHTVVREGVFFSTRISHNGQTTWPRHSRTLRSAGEPTAKPNVKSALVLLPTTSPGRSTTSCTRRCMRSSRHQAGCPQSIP